MRPLPELTPWNEWSWPSGADGRLRIQGCADCGKLVHPTGSDLPVCRSRSSEPTPVSGRATVVGYTINQRQWTPDFRPPYSIAVVALAEDPSVRLTTNIVGCDPGDVGIGLDVAVRFESHDDVWLPMFVPTGTVATSDPIEMPRVPVPRAPISDDRFEHRSVLSGVGRSALGRRLMVDPLSLTVDAPLEAVSDAGLRLEEIDGLSTYPGAVGMGMGEAGVAAVEEPLRLHPTWINGGGHIPGPGGAVIAADARGGKRTVPPRAVLPHRVEVDVRLPRPPPGRRWTGLRRPPVAGTVRRPVGGELDRSQRQPVPPPLQGDTRDPRDHRHQRTAERGPQSGGHPPGADDDGRLHGRPAGHHAVRTVRLRCALRPTMPSSCEEGIVASRIFGHPSVERRLAPGFDPLPKQVGDRA